MKIIQILPELNAGGVERGTVELAAFLVAAGHEALVISNGGRLVADLERCGARHIAVPVHRKSVASLWQLRGLQRILTEERADILHLRSRVPGWLAWLVWRGMDPRTRPRLVSTVHGFYSVNAYSAVMTRGERIIAVSESVRQYVLDNYPKVANDIIRVIPRGIEPANFGEKFRPAEAWLRAWQAERPGVAGKRVLLLPGRITRLKGHDEFFELIAALKRQGVAVHGLVAGDTHPKKRAYLAELHATVRRLGIDGEVEFLGHRHDLREVMAVSDVVCGLSRQPESFGRTVLEALALGKPVLGYDCGGVGELLSQLFPMGRVALGDRAGLLETARAILGGRERPLPVGEPFTLGAMCRATLAVYQELR
ncbi:MAG: glycosyltransferase family 4 protein [Verrucomicrobia bacterium]|nr:MAG: glycosyltransferase family 4 protein [Verrucomicrobiota bacterium]